MSLPSLSFIVPILLWDVFLIAPVFLKWSLVFPILLFSSISLHCSFKKAFLSLLAILWNSAFSWVYLSLSSLPFASLLSSAICKASSDNLFAFLHFFSFGMILVTGSCTVLQTYIHSSSDILSTRSNPLNLFLLLLTIHIFELRTPKVTFDSKDESRPWFTRVEEYS